jgi:hypothetical protein
MVYSLGMEPSEVGSESVGEGGVLRFRLVSSFFMLFLSIMSLLCRYLSSVGCLLLGFLVCRLGVMVVSLGEEEKEK